MNNIKEIKDTFSFKINKCTYYKETRLLETDKGNFIIKKNKQNNKDLFRYLESKNFNNYLNLYDSSTDYEVYPYIENIEMTKEEKVLDIVYLISLLHNRTTFYKTTNIDLIQSLYEDVNKKILYFNNYYENIRSLIEEENYMSPSGYLFLRNMTVVFKSLDDSKMYIEKWYEIAKNKKNYRVSTIHNYLELDHLLKNDNSYLISWDKSCKASPIYDIISLYQESYEFVDFHSVFDLYISKYPLYEEELYLLFSLLLIPRKIEFNNREIINTKNVYELTNYLINTINFISKYNSKKTDSKAD